MVRNPELPLYPAVPPPPLVPPPPPGRASSSHLGHELLQNQGLEQSRAVGLVEGDAQTPLWTAQDLPNPARGEVPVPPERPCSSVSPSPLKDASSLHESGPPSSRQIPAQNEEMFLNQTARQQGLVSNPPQPMVQPSAKGLHWSSLLGDTGIPCYLNSMTLRTPHYLNPNLEPPSGQQENTALSRPIIDPTWESRGGRRPSPIRGTVGTASRGRVFM